MGMKQALWDLVSPYVQQVLAALLVAAVAVIRAWLQRHVALAEATNAELESHARVNAGQPALPGHEKKARAMEAVAKRLPLGVRPVTVGGLNRLVEAQVPKAKKNSTPPPKA